MKNTPIFMGEIFRSHLCFLSGGFRVIGGGIGLMYNKYLSFQILCFIEEDAKGIVRIISLTRKACNTAFFSPLCDICMKENLLMTNSRKTLTQPSTNFE